MNKFQKNHPVNTCTYVLATLWFALPHWTEGKKPTQVQFSPQVAMNYWVWWWCESEPCVMFEKQQDFFKSRTNLTDHRTQVCPTHYGSRSAAAHCFHSLWSLTLPEPVQPLSEHGTNTGPSFSRTFWTSRAAVTTAPCPWEGKTVLHPNISTRHFWQLCTQEKGTRTTQTLHVQSFSPSSSSPSESPNTSSSYLKISLWT